MTLISTVNGDIKKAMLAKEPIKLKALRAIKAALLLEQTSGAGEITKEAEINILQRLIKQRKDSALIYEQNNRVESAQEELHEVQFIETYLPKQLSQEELKTSIESIISKIGATSMSDMGKVMGIASKQLAGKVAGKSIADMVKKLLS